LACGKEYSCENINKHENKDKLKQGKQGKYGLYPKIFRIFLTFFPSTAGPLISNPGKFGKIQTNFKKSGQPVEIRTVPNLEFFLTFFFLSAIFENIFSPFLSLTNTKTSMGIFE